MKIELDNNELDFIINVLGELPTKTNAFMLLQKIQIQKSMQEKEEIKPE
jgi:hypothetical protein